MDFINSIVNKRFHDEKINHSHLNNDFYTFQ